jgi:hypothetical protein
METLDISADIVASFGEFWCRLLLTVLGARELDDFFVEVVTVDDLST